MTEAETQLAPRRWTVILSGLLCAVLALVVLYTNRAAFQSPLALVVVAAIGLAAVLLQVRLRHREVGSARHLPLGLNVVGILSALTAIVGDYLGLSAQAAVVLALLAVSCFTVSGGVILHAVRKRGAAAK